MQGNNIQNLIYLKNYKFKIKNISIFTHKIGNNLNDLIILIVSRFQKHFQEKWIINNIFINRFTI